MYSQLYNVNVTNNHSVAVVLVLQRRYQRVKVKVALLYWYCQSLSSVNVIYRTRATNSIRTTSSVSRSVTNSDMYLIPLDLLVKH